ncbi:hypothetical protein M1N46_00765 [Dehalococcoidia bacterium]|nr:hypothetical protein [Dehalococcoidia bacterium]
MTNPAIAYFTEVVLSTIEEKRKGEAEEEEERQKQGIPRSSPRHLDGGESFVR